MNNRSIVVFACIAAVIGFGLPIALGILTRSSSDSALVNLSGVLGPYVYLLFVSVSFFLLPSWAWFKSKRRVLALVLLSIGLLFIYFLYSYISDPESTDDPGMVVFGFIMYVPPFTFLVQLMIYIGCKVAARRGSRLDHDM